VSVWSGLI